MNDGNGKKEKAFSRESTMWASSQSRKSRFKVVEKVPSSLVKMRFPLLNTYYKSFKWVILNAFSIKFQTRRKTTIKVLDLLKGFSTSRACLFRIIEL